MNTCPQCGKSLKRNQILCEDCYEEVLWDSPEDELEETDSRKGEEDYDTDMGSREV